MDLRNAFFAYPAEPSAIGACIESAVQSMRQRSGQTGLETWRNLDICGQFIAGQVLSKITKKDALIADITKLNFNVLYEIGFAIGIRKPVFIVRNFSIQAEDIELSELGLFDTIGYKGYQNSEELTQILIRGADLTPIDVPIGLNSRQPLYSVEPKFKIDLITRINSKIKRSGLDARVFDPLEQTRISAFDAIKKVSESYGVILSLLSPDVQDARMHNLRTSFVAGLAEGMEKVRLLVQSGDWPVPIDYRDFVRCIYSAGDLDSAFGDFAAQVTKGLTSQAEFVSGQPENFLQSVDLGGSTAENELRDLPYYYLETGPYQRVVRGEVRVVVGRKGAGKTAIFYRARDRIRRNRQHLVLDLKPESYQLRKLRDAVVGLLQQGTQEHLVMAFWEYALYLEICAKILEEDRDKYTRNPDAFGLYQKIEGQFGQDNLVREGDFSDRIEALCISLAERYSDKFGNASGTVLNKAQLTELLYRHDLGALRRIIAQYLTLKEQLWIFFDNIDKGWPSHGVESTDILILRTLLEATRRLERDLSKSEVETHTVLFIRNDIYELLLEQTPDRGKETRANVDWTDADLLREIIRLRLARSLDKSPTFPEVWAMICDPFVKGQSSSQYLIDRCLMRPRALIDLINHCRSVAVNLHHEKITEDDIRKGLAIYSNDLVSEINLEVRDVFPEAQDVLYHFIGLERTVSVADLQTILLKEGWTEGHIPVLVDLLIWHAILGLVWPDGRVEYIFNVNYNHRLFRAQMDKLKSSTGLVFQINPAFWPALLGEDAEQDQQSLL